MAEMMDLYNEAENSVLGTLIADAEVNASLVFTRCLLYTSPSPRDIEETRMPSSA